ncbi:MAG: hypothetical protein JNK37_13500 [Verrucomicrobiales bacterium]|nr:hypothetical protein [Verrucomicrobiales bacterium]
MKTPLDGLQRFVINQQRLTREAFTSFEAGDLGYQPHRKIAAMFAPNCIVQPQDWDERGEGVKNDQLDAMALSRRLDRFTRGKRKAFNLARVLSEEGERNRALTRLR